MDIGLFSHGLFVAFAAANTAAIYYLVQKLIRHKSLRFTLPFLAGMTLIVSGLALWGVQAAFPADKAPPDLWFMVLPFSLSAGLLSLAFWVRKFRMGALAGANVLLGLLVSLLLINSYYHYYPTVGSLFGRAAINPTTTVVYPTKTDGAKPLSLEAQLYNDKAPTAGRVTPLTIPGKISKFRPRAGYLYEPAINVTNPRLQLPVIVLMPGVPGNPVDWLNGGGLITTMNDFAARHHGVTPYVVVVDNTGSVTNDTECVDSSRGNVDTYLSVDVPNYIKAHYSVSHDPSQWAIGGLSMGGMCGIMVTLRHSDVYHYFLDFGGETGPEVGPKQKTIATLFNGSEATWQEYQPEWLLSHRKYSGVGGFFAVGRNDRGGLVAGVEGLNKLAQDAGLETVLQQVGGEHTFNVWQQSYKDSLPWISNRLGATQCQGACY